MCGRLPYQNPFSSLTTEDVAAVQTALEETGLVELQHRPLKDLSGGERATCLARHGRSTGAGHSALG